MICKLLRDRNRRQGADLLSMRERDDGAAHQAAGRGPVVRTPAALADAVVAVVIIIVLALIAAWAIGLLDVSAAQSLILPRSGR